MPLDNVGLGPFSCKSSRAFLSSSGSKCESIERSFNPATDAKDSNLFSFSVFITESLLLLGKIKYGALGNGDEITDSNSDLVDFKMKLSLSLTGESSSSATTATWLWDTATSTDVSPS